MSVSTTTTTTTTTTADTADDLKDLPTAGSSAPQGPLDYVLMAVPAKSPDELKKVWDFHFDIVMKEKIGRSARFEIPDLPVGTFDTLMQISDELGRIDTFAENLCRKIISTLTELYANSSSSSLAAKTTPVWVVNKMSPDKYMAQFVWDEKKFPHKAPLRETVSRVQASLQRHEQELRSYAGHYTAAERALAADTRKETGSLATRSLADIVKPEDVLTSEYLTTVFVVVPKHNEKQWLSEYETIAEFVLPRSAKVLKDDADSKLYSVTVFKRTEDDFKNSARERHYIIRDVDVNSLSQESREEAENRANEKKRLENKLNRWCIINFGEVFSAWLHIKAIRIFVESVLRYGLPPCFVATVVRPGGKNHDLKKTLAALAKIYQPIIVSSQATLFGGKDDESESFSVAAGGQQEKLLPFVYTLFHLDLVPQNL